MNFLFNIYNPRFLSRKILAVVFIVSSLVTIAMTFVQLSFNYFQEIGELEQTLELVEKSYSKAIAGNLWQLNDSQLQTGLVGILSIPGIQYVAVYDKNKLIAKAGTLINVKTIKKEVQLIYDDENDNQKSYIIGRLLVHGSVDHVRNKIYHQVFTLFITQFIKALIVSFFIYLSIQNLVTKHLVFISRYLQGITSNTLNNELALNRKKVAIDKEDELDILTRSINKMRNDLNESYNELSDFNKNLEEAIQAKTQLVFEQRQKLEYANKMSSLGEMAGGIAHEINNPITIISSTSRILRKYIEKGIFDPEKFIKACDDIDKTVVRISKIISGLRNVSRDASEEGFTNNKIFDVFQDVLALCGEKFKINKVAINIDLDQEVFQTIIPCKRVQLSQVFLNLLGNSYDAIENQDERWVRIECSVDNDNLQIRFIDSGHGIPLALQEKILMPFFTTKEIGKGTGLGLSLSHSIIKDHKGTFEIDNDCKNTCFLITLPLRRV